jgi:hypothetical protein
MSYTEHLAPILDKAVDIAAIAAIAIMVLNGDPSFEALGAVTTVALGKAYMTRGA